jgi:hypothetical protein
MSTKNQNNSGPQKNNTDGSTANYRVKDSTVPKYEDGQMNLRPDTDIRGPERAGTGR